MNKTLEKILEDELFENENFEGEGNLQIKNTSEGTKMPIQLIGNSIQDGEPSLENPIEIRNCGDNGNINFSVVNKNLINFAQTKKITRNGIDFYYNKDMDEFSFEGTATESIFVAAIFEFQKINYDSSKEYILRISNKIDSFSVNATEINVSTNGFIYSGQTSVKISDLDKNSPNGIGISGNVVEGQKYSGKFKMMIYEKTTDSEEYVLHQEQKNSIPVQKPFRSVNEDRDTFIFSNGKWYERHIISKHVITGDEAVKFTMSGEHPVFILTPYPNIWEGVLPSSGVISGYCNMFTVNGGFHTVTVVLQRVGDARIFELFFFNITEEFEENVDLFKNKLKELYNSGKPLYFTYKRDEPELILCTEEQTKELDKLMQITAYNDVTNIICEDEIPCNFKVDAKISKIKKLIEKENANV